MKPIAARFFCGSVMLIVLAVFLSGLASAQGDSTTVYLPLLFRNYLLPNITRVSLASDGNQGSGSSRSPSISADGRYVAFLSRASDLVSGDTNVLEDIFVHDRETRETERVSVASDGSQANGESRSPSISGDGRYVAFTSKASNLVGGDTNGKDDIFVHVRQTGETSRVSVASGGEQANGGSFAPALSADGRYVAFHSYANNLASGDTNRDYDIFVHDRQSGQTELVSVASSGEQANRWSEGASISGDGRYVAFRSLADNLVSGDTNINCHWHYCWDIFVHDRQTGETERVSVASDGEQANEDSSGAAISADGRFVAFVSAAGNLVRGDTNLDYDVFVHDRQNGETRRISVASDGEQANGGSGGPSTSADGRYVAFTSWATNLASGDAHYADLFIHDRLTGQTWRVSLAYDGTQANDNSSSPSLSADGSWVAFGSYASNLAPGDTNGVEDTFVCFPGGWGGH